MAGELLLIIVIVALLTTGYFVINNVDEVLPDFFGSGSSNSDKSSLPSSTGDSGNTGGTNTARSSSITANQDTTVDGLSGSGKGGADTIGSTDTETSGSTDSSSMTPHKSQSPIDTTDMHETKPYDATKESAMSEVVDDAESDNDDGMGTNYYQAEEESIGENTEEKYCPDCGSATGIDADFCPNCGNSFGSDSVVLRLGGEVLELPYGEPVGTKVRNHMIATDFSEYAARHVSREHCQFTQESEATYLVDLDSSHGTAVNGDKVSSGDRVPVNDDDKIRFADVATATIVSA